MSTALDDLEGDGDVDDLDDLDDLGTGVEQHHPARGWGLALVVGGALGLAAAFTLAVDKYRILEDPSYQPSCNLNPVLSCGSVMVKPQAEAFGFPNPLIGLVAFGIVITIGVLLASGTRLPTWVLTGLAAGSVLGLGFVHWLAFQSLYRIGALCPWCMVVWAVVIPIAVTSVLQALRSGRGRTARVADVVWDVRFLVVALWYLAFAVAILVRFWSYWRTLA